MGRHTVILNSSRALSPRNAAGRPRGTCRPARRGRRCSRGCGRRGEVRCPEEAVGAEALGQRRDGPLVGIAADPAPLLEVVGRRVLQRHAAAHRGVAVHGVHAVEPVADPAAARLEHEDLERREAVEHGVVEQRRELGTHAVGACTEAVSASCADVLPAAHAGALRPLRLERGVDRERHVEVLGGGEHDVVVGVAERLLRWVNGATKQPLAPSPTARSSSAAAAAGSASDRCAVGNEPSPAVGAPLADPAVVRLGVRLGQLGVLELGLPQQTGRGVEDGGVDVLGVEQLQPLASGPSRRRGVVVVGDLGVEHHLRQVRVRPSPASVDGIPVRAIWDRLAADLELVEPVLVLDDAQGAGRGTSGRCSAPRGRTARGCGRRRRRRRPRTACASRAWRAPPGAECPEGPTGLSTDP